MENVRHIESGFFGVQTVEKSSTAQTSRDIVERAALTPTLVRPETRDTTLLKWDVRIGGMNATIFRLYIPGKVKDAVSSTWNGTLGKVMG